MSNKPLRSGLYEIFDRKLGKEEGSIQSEAYVGVRPDGQHDLVSLDLVTRELEILSKHPLSNESGERFLLPHRQSSDVNVTRVAEWPMATMTLPCEHRFDRVRDNSSYGVCLICGIDDYENDPW